ncbi:MAG: GIY-YIG nuclease family protein [Bacteroidetes bacterium]|jgi:putative endonuclease|nr:GIY-YIG nuclease family protein [Bacteroidota bacterium]
MIVKYLYVYIIKCNDGTYYTGVTNNIEKRLVEHNEGIHKESYTYFRRPVELAFCELFSDYNLAIQWEKKIKKWSAKKKEALINSDWKRLIEEAKCKNETSHEIYNTIRLNK